MRGLSAFSGIKASMGPANTGGTPTPTPSTTLDTLAASRGQVPSQMTNPGVDNYTSRTRHYFHKDGDVSNIRPILLGWGFGASFAAESIASTYTVKMSLEYPVGSGTFYEFYFSGSTTGTVPVGGLLIPDANTVASAITVPAGAAADIRTQVVTRPTGNLVPAWAFPSTPSALGLSEAVSTTATTTTGAMSASASATAFFGPAAIMGDVAVANARAGVIIGDSITIGFNETSGSGVKGGLGFMARGLDPVMPYMKIAQGGIGALDIAGSSQTLTKITALFAAMNMNRSSAIAIMAIGINDLAVRGSRSAAQVLADRATIAGALPASMTKFGATLTPRTTTSDSYATVANQALKTDGSMSTAWQSINGSVRATEAWAGNYIDAAAFAHDATGAATFVWGGPFAPTTDGTHPSTGKHAAMATLVTNRVTALLGTDATAPTLSSATDAANGSTAGTLSVTTNDISGTLYWYVSTSAVGPSAVNLKSGSGAAAFGSQAVTATGAQAVAATGLSASTTYYAHFLHSDTAGNDSTIASGDGFTTTTPDVTAPTLSSPTDAANGSTGGTLSVSTDEGNGTLYWFVSTSGTPPSAANLKTGTGAVSFGNQAVSGTGVQNASATGLTASTVYYAHFLHRDAAGNDSSISSGDGFTTSASGYAYESWTGPGWIDASDTGNITVNGSNQVTAATNKRSGGGNLAQAGTLANMVVGATTKNGRQVIRVTRDVTSVSTVPRLEASVSDPISTMFQGDDKPYTVIIAYTPTDTNTGYPWAASNRIDVTNFQAILYARRNATAPSVRRNLNVTTNDVTWGSGQASGTARIVAIKHTGTAVTVWDNSASVKSVNGTAQDTTTFNSSLIFRLFASEGGGNTSPYIALFQGNMDFYEIVVEDSAKSDADVQQAITDLGAKWGITV